MEEKIEKIIDLSYLELTFDGNVMVIGKVLQSFLKNTANELLDLEEHGKEENWHDVKQLAHKLKSSFNVIGAKRLGKLLLDVEIASESADTTDVSDLIVEIKNLGGPVIREVEFQLEHNYGS